MLWNSPRSRLRNHYSSAVKQSLSLENRLAKNPVLKNAYLDTVKTDNDSGYFWILEPTELPETRNEPQWLLPHHPVVNPNKPGKVRRVCNAACEFERHSFNKSLFIGPDLLQNLVKIIFRFREKPFGTSADIEAWFLRGTSPSRRCKMPFGEKINQTTYPRMNTLGIYLKPKTRHHVQILFYDVQPRIMRKNSQSLLEL